MLARVWLRRGWKGCGQQMINREVARLSFKFRGLQPHHFEAAFPSIAHDLLHKSLAGLGVPSTVCRLVECLYMGHGCRISTSAGLQEGFMIGAGIRQGCPLSPLLFAVVLDPLLRRILRDVRPMDVRAHADDLATCCRAYRQRCHIWSQCSLAWRGFLACA